VGYESDHSIVRQNPIGWIFLGIVVIAIIIAGMIMFGFYKTPSGYHPSWAPDGCRVIADERYGSRVIVRVSDPENFDTEAECAKVILDALVFEDAFFRQTAAGNEEIPRCVELQLPRYAGSRGEFYIQYYEIRTDEFNFNVLRVVDGPVPYRNEEITLSELRQVAEGELQLGFLEGG